MPGPAEKAERLELARAALEGPLARVSGFVLSPEVTAETLADVIAAIALRISDRVWTEIDALP